MLIIPGGQRATQRPYRYTNGDSHIPFIDSVSSNTQLGFSIPDVIVSFINTESILFVQLLTTSEEDEAKKYALAQISCPFASEALLSKNVQFSIIQSIS
jgi:hypothetical protein